MAGQQLIVDIRNGSNEVDGTFLYLTRAGGGRGAPLLQPRHHFLSLHTPSLSAPTFLHWDFYQMWHIMFTFSVSKIIQAIKERQQT